MENIRLLLVDDENDFRRTVAKRLTKRGIVPEQAANGRECLSILEKQPFDVVVLDVKMPGMDGIEVLHHIKNNYPNTEVIMLTGHATTQNGVDGIKTGAFDYLSKPIELEHLLSKIKQAHDKILRDEERVEETKFKVQMQEQMAATERLASLGTLAAGVAHEINNPLAIIKESTGFMELILKKEEFSDMPRKKDFELALSKIEKGVDRARRITLQLLGFSRKDDSVLAEVNLKELIDDTIQLVEREAINKDVGIGTDIDDNESTVWCDIYQLRQVLINLLTNAIHATDSAGKVNVSIEDAGDKFALIVKDTGRGIPKENLKRIFEPFFSTKPPGKGTGLGLFVTRGIIEKLGGEIEVTSRLGHGTSFCVKVPKFCEFKKDLVDDERVQFLNKITKQGRPAH